MKIGIVGYTGSGKSALFELLSGIRPDPALAHIGQSAMAPIPEPRIAQLCEIYHPKKITQASLELLDTPGLNRTHEGNATRLAVLREAGCLVLVVAGFAGADPKSDLQSFAEDLLFSDLDIITRRIEKLAESSRKPKPTREQELAELECLKPLAAMLDSGQPLTTMKLSEEQLKATRSFCLLTEKPLMVIVNTSDDEPHPERFTSLSTAKRPVLAAPIGLELELARLDEEERASFAAEMGLSTASSRDAILRRMLDVSGQMLFFTAGDKEVRTWILPQGGTALDAAAGIHTDLARGFIRAEIMTCSDLVRLGSEREVKAHSLVRQEPKDYVVKDDDILHIRFNV